MLNYDLLDTFDQEARTGRETSHTCVYIYIYTHMYIYIYIERERYTYTTSTATSIITTVIILCFTPHLPDTCDQKARTGRETVYVYMCMYVYIYIYTHIHNSNNNNNGNNTNSKIDNLNTNNNNYTNNNNTFDQEARTGRETSYTTHPLEVFYIIMRYIML